MLLCDLRIRRCTFVGAVSICVKVKYASWSVPKEAAFHRRYVFEPVVVTSSWLDAILNAAG